MTPTITSQIPIVSVSHISSPPPDVADRWLRMGGDDDDDNDDHGPRLLHRRKNEDDDQEHKISGRKVPTCDGTSDNWPFFKIKSE